MYYKCTLSYDGTRYFGWQKTRMGPSIQEALQAAIRQITGEHPIPEAASRTDRGVHAVGQIVSFLLNKHWAPNVLAKALNAVLPQDIRITALTPAADDFHPTLHATEKEYRYSLCLGEIQNPIYRLYSWAFRKPIDLEKMKRNARDFLGKRDFSGFSNQKEKNPYCTLKEIGWILLPENRLQVSITGDRFLYKMVRTMVGTLLSIGCGQIPEDRALEILESKDRKKAGITAPAHGLVLYRVTYLE